MTMFAASTDVLHMFRPKIQTQGRIEIQRRGGGAGDNVGNTHPYGRCEEGNTDPCASGMLTNVLMHKTPLFTLSSLHAHVNTVIRRASFFFAVPLFMMIYKANKTKGGQMN